MTMIEISTGDSEFVIRNSFGDSEFGNSELTGYLAFHTFCADLRHFLQSTAPSGDIVSCSGGNVFPHASQNMSSDWLAESDGPLAGAPPGRLPAAQHFLQTVCPPPASYTSSAVQSKSHV